MSQQAPEAGAWVLAAVDAMQQNGSWTGRIHVQKLLFIVKELGLARTPFEFVLYDYGPYSFDVDEKFVELEMLGKLVRAYREPGYGPSYYVTPEGGAARDTLGQTERSAIDCVAKSLGTRNSRELELLATCLWIERSERPADDSAIIDRVIELKPRYVDKRAEVEKSLCDMRTVVKSLSQAS